MMRHVKAISIKWGFTAIILLSLLTIFEGITLQQIMIISLLVTGVTYLIGDLLILPVFNNLVASIVDFGFGFLGVWLLSALFIEQTVAVVVISTAIAYLFTFCEALFHIYMKEKVLPKKRGQLIPFPNMRYQTEFSKENDPKINKE